MKLLSLFAGLILTVSLFTGQPVVQAAQKAQDEPVIKLETSQGDILIQLNTRKAPITAANFIQYVKSGQYDGTIFHRVIKDFMIQAGGMNAEMKEKRTLAPIRNESNNGLSNKKYTISMARTSEPHSASAQFFINTKDNAFLDYGAQGANSWGYAVFGKVIKGQDIVDRIEKVATGRKRGHDDVPVEPIIIKKAVVLEDEAN